MAEHIIKAAFNVLDIGCVLHQPSISLHHLLLRKHRSAVCFKWGSSLHGKQKLQSSHVPMWSLQEASSQDFNLCIQTVYALCTNQPLYNSNSRDCPQQRHYDICHSELQWSTDALRLNMVSMFLIVGPLHSTHLRETADMMLENGANPTMMTQFLNSSNVPSTVWPQDVKTAKYFHVVEEVVNKLTSGRIWNMEETGVQLEHRPGKVDAHGGTKYLHSATSGNRETISHCCSNANGHSFPPTLLWKVKCRHRCSPYNKRRSSWQHMECVRFWLD